MGKVIVIGFVLWLLMQEPEAAEPAAPKRDAVDRISGAFRDATSAVEGATRGFRQVLADGSRLTDAVERAGSVFSGGLDPRSEDPSEPQSGYGNVDAAFNVDRGVTDYDQTYSAEDPMSWASAPVRYS